MRVSSLTKNTVGFYTYKEHPISIKPPASTIISITYANNLSEQLGEHHAYNKVFKSTAQSRTYTSCQRGDTHGP
jgi:hypothetical protein